MCPPADPTSTPFPRVKEATTMVVVGADVHKFKHTFVAVDEVGRKLGEKTVKATTPTEFEAATREAIDCGPEQAIAEN
jgi:hypothetical protein